MFMRVVGILLLSVFVFGFVGAASGVGVNFSVGEVGEVQGYVQQGFCSNYGGYFVGGLVLLVLLCIVFNYIKKVRNVGRRRSRK